MIILICKINNKFPASVQDVWQALVDPKIIEEWGGDVYGKNIKVSRNKELVQE